MATIFDATPIGTGRRFVARTLGRAYTSLTGKPYFVGLDQCIARAISESRHTTASGFITITTRLEWGLGGHTLTFPYDRGDRRINDNDLSQRIRRVLDAARDIAHKVDPDRRDHVLEAWSMLTEKESDEVISLEGENLDIALVWLGRMWGRAVRAQDREYAEASGYGDPMRRAKPHIIALYNLDLEYESEKSLRQAFQRGVEMIWSRHDVSLSFGAGSSSWPNAAGFYLIGGERRAAREHETPVFRLDNRLELAFSEIVTDHPARIQDPIRRLSHGLV